MNPVDPSTHQAPPAPAHPPSGPPSIEDSDKRTSASSPRRLRQQIASAVMSRRKSSAELQPPRLPVLLDGRSVEPKHVAHHPAPVRYYITSPDTYREGVLHVFLRAEAAAEYLADVGQRSLKEPNRPEAGPKPGPSRHTEEARLPAAGTLRSRRAAPTQGYYGPVGGDVDLYEDIDFGGWAWTFLASWGSINDFRWVFPPFYTNINDRVSSANVINIYYADPNVQELPYVILFEHINKGGAQLWLYPRGGPQGNGFYPNLGDFGWNDVASSMRYY